MTAMEEAFKKAQEARRLEYVEPIISHVFVPVRSNPGSCNECGHILAIHRFKKATG